MIPMSEYYQIFIKKKLHQELFKAVLMNEYFFDWHVQQISYIHCKFKGWSTSAILNRADRLSRYPKLFYQITLPYLFRFSYLCQIVFHKSPRRTLVHLSIVIVTIESLCVKYSLRLRSPGKEKDPPHLRQISLVLRPGIEPGTRGL